MKKRIWGIVLLVLGVGTFLDYNMIKLLTGAEAQVDLFSIGRPIIACLLFMSVGIWLIKKGNKEIKDKQD